LLLENLDNRIARSDSVSMLTVLYDGSCSLCRASVARLRRMDRGGRVAQLDLHDPQASVKFPQVDREEAMRLMQAVDGNGRVYSGVDAWAHIGLSLPGWKLLAWILLVPGIHFIGGAIYGWVARNRYRWNQDLCADGSCKVHLDHAPRGSNPPAAPR
jgi:predicted DCC family thiol-disulfide oxidoreductase YuxK